MDHIKSAINFANARDNKIKCFKGWSALIKSFIRIKAEDRIDKSFITNILMKPFIPCFDSNTRLNECRPIIVMFEEI